MKNIPISKKDFSDIEKWLNEKIEEKEWELIPTLADNFTFYKADFCSGDFPPLDSLELDRIRKLYVEQLMKIAFSAYLV